MPLGDSIYDAHMSKSGGEGKVPEELTELCSEPATLDTVTAGRGVGALRKKSSPGLPAVDLPSRYEIGELIGRGGMGAVLECRDALIRRDIAIKVNQNGAEGGLRFLREARLQGQLEHPSVVPIYDMGITEAGEQFFTMKRVQGKTLKEMLGLSTSEYPLRRALGDFSRICEALAYSHKRGVVHRDIKPSNIMIGQFGAVYLIDWGIAKQLRDSLPEETTSETAHLSDGQLTTTGAAIGTPAFMSPEQRIGHSDERSDIFCLGRVLDAILERESPPPPELTEVADRATQLDPESRYAEVESLREDIERYLDGERDEQRRRDIADRCLASAERVVQQDVLSEDEHREAMRSVGRALALAPDHEAAIAMFVRLMERKPDEIPAEALASLATSRGVSLAENLRLGRISYCGVFVAVPITIWAGLRDWLPLSIMCGAWLLAILLLAWTATKPCVSRQQLIPPYLAINVATALTSLVTGWFVFLPAIVAMTGAGFSLYFGRQLRWLVLLSGSLAILLPALLFATGSLPEGLVAGGDWPLANLAHALDARDTLAVAFGTLAVALITSLYFTRIGEVMEAAELELHLRSWQLRNLAPGLARNDTATESISPSL